MASTRTRTPARERKARGNGADVMEALPEIAVS